MIDITHKVTTLRSALAQAILRLSKSETAEALVSKTVPKGDVFEFARAAGLLAIKQTQHVIPDCHPLPIESAKIKLTTIENDLIIECEVKTIYRTGVEVEAMHGAMIAALTAFDMLKPIDKGLEIVSVKLINKKGGKSEFSDEQIKPIRTAVMVCSDSVTAGKKEDKSGKLICEILEKWDIKCETYLVIADEPVQIASETLRLKNEGIDLLLITGGTGLSPRDKTPEAIAPLLTREIPGIMEAARNYGQERMPYAMLSRGIAGTIDNMLVVTLPGSSRGAKETMDALFPFLLHIFSVQKKKDPHSKNNQSSHL